LFFNERVIIRLPERTLSDIDFYTDKHMEKYENRSHFIRVAILREIHRCKNGII